MLFLPAYVQRQVLKCDLFHYESSLEHLMDMNQMTFLWQHLLKRSKCFWLSRNLQRQVLTDITIISTIYCFPFHINLCEKVMPCSLSLWAGASEALRRFIFSLAYKLKEVEDATEWVDSRCNDNSNKTSFEQMVNVY